MSSHIVENCIRAINKAKSLKDLNIFIRETYDLALKQAEQSAQRAGKQNERLSTIDGSIFSIKDNFSTKSIQTTCGSKMLENYVPSFNATVVERILAAGSVMIGKTNLDEFGMGSVSSSFFGTTKNPLSDLNDTTDDFFISGGSSGGSAASVSAGLVDFSIGSDTGGSVRNPASICGCIGYKPTYGLISRYGLIPLNNYFDTVGILSQSMETIVNVLNVIAGPDANDATTIKTRYEPIKLDKSENMNKLRIGVPLEFYPSGLSSSNMKGWKTALEKFEKIGNATIVPVSMPNVPYTMSCYSILTSCEVASNFSRFDGIKYGHHTPLDLSESSVNEYTFEKVIKKNRNESLGKLVKSRIVSGNYFLLKDNYANYFLKSHKMRQAIIGDFEKAFNDIQNKVDVLITPTCFHETIKYSEYMKQEQVFDEKDFFTACCNIAGVPAITVPVITSKSTNLPVGVQIISKWGRDDLLLNVADWFIKNNDLTLHSIKS